MRRTGTVLLLLAVLTAVAWTLWTWVRPDAPSTDPWRAVPTGSIIILEVPDALATWDRVTHSSQLWGVLEQCPAAAGTNRTLVRCMEQMERDPALQTALKGMPMLIAVMRTGQGPGLLAIVQQSTGRPIPITSLKTVLGADDAALTALASGDMVEIRPDTSLTSLRAALRDDLLLLASSPIILEEALLQLKAPEGATDSVLTRVRGTLGAGADAHVLVHGTRMQHLLGTWWTPDALKDVDLPEGWTALDLRVRPDILLMSGLIATERPEPQLASIQGQGMGRLAVMQVLPSATNALEVQHISDPLRWLTDREPGSTPDAGLAQALFSWVEGEMGIATAWDDVADLPQQWAFFRTGDPEAAELALLGTCPDGSPCDTLSYRGHRFTRSGILNGHERLLGTRFVGFEQPWWTLWRDLVLFAPSPIGLQACIDAATDGHSLASDLRVMSGFERLGQESGLTLWCDMARSQGLLAAGMRTDAVSEFRAHSRNWSRLGGLTLQVSPGQHGYQHVVVGLQYAPLEVQDIGVLWSTTIGAPVTRKPDIVRNHVNDTREVLVQDTQHRIHLLASTGKVLWTRQLDGPILGAVHQVDRFRNGKLQLVFNTAERIHLIDRNGKDVGGFPLALPARASAPLAVFDYENERDYRIVVPCTDGRVLNYGMEGAPVKGWEAPRLAAPATNAIRHIRIRNKDYLIVLDGSGNVQLLDRRGSERERTTLSLGAGGTILNVVPGLDLDLTRILWSDATGAVHEGTLAGAVSDPFAGKGMPGSAVLDGDSILARIAGDTLRVEHRDGVLFTRSFGQTIHPQVQWLSVGGGRTLVTAVLPDRDQLVLLDRSGNSWPGSPLTGAIPCAIGDLDRDDRLELVTATRNGQVVAYRLSSAADGQPQ